MSQQINLFNPIFLKQKQGITAVVMVRALGLLLAGGVALVLYHQQQVAALEQQAKALQTRLAQAEARQEKIKVEFAARQPSKALEAELAQAQAQLRALHAVDTVLRGGAMGDTTGYAGYFKALARQNVSGLWLTGVSVAGPDIGVRGRALEPALIPDYISRLTRESVMRGKTFGSLEISQAELANKDGAAEPAPYVEFSLQSVAGEEDK